MRRIDNFDRLEKMESTHLIWIDFGILPLGVDYRAKVIGLCESKNPMAVNLSFWNCCPSLKIQ